MDPSPVHAGLEKVHAPSASGSTIAVAKATRFSAVALVTKAASPPSREIATLTAVSVPAMGRVSVPSSERV